MSEMFSKEQLQHIVYDAIQARVSEKLKSGYSSPIDKFIESAIKDFGPKIETEFRELLTGCFDSTEYKAIVKEEFHRKVAKALVSKMSGAVEKSTADIMGNPELRAKVLLAMTNIIKENTRLSRLADSEEK